MGWVEDADSDGGSESVGKGKEGLSTPCKLDCDYFSVTKQTGCLSTVCMYVCINGTFPVGRVESSASMTVYSLICRYKGRGRLTNDCTVHVE